MITAMSLCWSFFSADLIIVPIAAAKKTGCNMAGMILKINRITKGGEKADTRFDIKNNDTTVIIIFFLFIPDVYNTKNGPNRKIVIANALKSMPA